MKLLIIGPQPEPITGNSLSNHIVSTFLPKYTDIQTDIINTSYKALKEDLGVFSIEKVLYYIKQYKNIGKIKHCDKVYITTGQTFFGVLKYLPYFLVSKFFKKELIVHIHGNHLHKEFENLKGIKKAVFHKILSMVDKGIVLSPSLRKNLEPFLETQNIYILENFVEDFLFDNPSQKYYSKLRVIYLSNLMQEKGILDLLEALKLLTEHNIKFEAKIAGGIDESLRVTVEKALGELQNVKYLGLVYGKEKKELLEWGNTFVFPTYYAMEGQPISIFEAMATGNIIITTQHAGIPDVFEEGKNGFYVDKNSPQDITSKLIKVNENIEGCKIISEHNRKEAKEKYQVNQFIEKLKNILISPIK